MTVRRSLYLLLMLAAGSAAHAAPVAVLAHAVERGEVLAASDFAMEDREPAQARGALRPTEAAGMEPRRRLMAGSVVRAPDLIAPRLVHRGEPVTIALRKGALSITTTGRALADGGRGELVRVVSNATNRTLEGVVESAGTVRIAAP